MNYGLSYREKHNLSESALTDAQRTLHYIAENMRMEKSISEDGYKHFQQAIEALEQEPCGKGINVPATDAISRQAVDTLVDELARAISDERCCISRGRSTATIMQDILDLPSVTPQPKVGHCKDCKHFEYDSVANVDGVPLIVAHEICSSWGDGCKTSEDGYCFLFEPKMQEVKE